MNTKDQNFLQDLFINEAKPALERHASLNDDAQEAYNRGYNNGLSLGTIQGKVEAYNELQPINEKLERTLNGESA